MRVDQYLLVVETALAAKTPVEVVYFLEAEGTNRMKIGYTSDHRGRISSLRNMSAVPLDLVRFLWGGFDLEQAIHAAFSDCRKYGEWFEITPGLRHFIEATSALEAWECSMDSSASIVSKHLNRIFEAQNFDELNEAVQSYLGRYDGGNVLDALSWIKCSLASYATGGDVRLIPHSLLDGWQPTLEDEAPDEYAQSFDETMKVGHEWLP